MLREVAQKTKEKFNANVLKAEDRMDDGSTIVLTITLDEEKVIVLDSLRHKLCCSLFSSVSICRLFNLEPKVEPKHY